MANDKNGVKRGSNFIYKKGKLPILLSASHAVKQYRESQIKLSDYLTGPLTMYLAEKVNCSYFVRTFNANDDPNYPLGVTLKQVENEYLRSLIAFLREYRHFLVVDIHGASNRKISDASMWSDNCLLDILRIFEYNFNSNGLSTDFGLEYLGGQVTRQSGLITNAFQLELKRRIRSLDNVLALESLLNSMEESIYEVCDYSRNFERVRRIRNG